MAPAISIIMPVFRDKEFVAEAMDSILAQDFTNFELIVIDDCGEDGAMDVVRSYDDPRIRVFRNAVNSGPAVSRNVGLDNAKGEILACMDADDIVERDWLSKQYAEMLKNPELAVLSCDLRHFGLRSGIHTCYQKPASIAAALPLDCPLHNPGALIRKRLLDEKRIRYNDTLRFGIDYQLWADLWLAGLPMRGSGACLCHYRTSEGNISTTKAAAREKLVGALRLKLLGTFGFSPTAEALPWLLRSRLLTKNLPPEDFAALRRLAVELLKLKTPAPHIWRHEVAKFLVSLMPRAKGLKGQLHNLESLLKISPRLAFLFVKGRLFGIKE